MSLARFIAEKYVAGLTVDDLALKVVQQRLDNIQRVPKAICEI
jgi:hypothetical protein